MCIVERPAPHRREIKDSHETLVLQLYMIKSSTHRDSPNLPNHKNTILSVFRTVCKLFQIMYLLMVFLHWHSHMTTEWTCPCIFWGFCTLNLSHWCNAHKHPHIKQRYLIFPKHLHIILFGSLLSFTYSLPWHTLKKHL